MRAARLRSHTKTGQAKRASPTLGHGGVGKSSGIAVKFSLLNSGFLRLKRFSEAVLTIRRGPDIVQACALGLLQVHNQRGEGGGVDCHGGFEAWRSWSGPIPGTSSSTLTQKMSHLFPNFLIFPLCRAFGHLLRITSCEYRRASSASPSGPPNSRRSSLSLLAYCRRPACCPERTPTWAEVA